MPAATRAAVGRSATRTPDPDNPPSSPPEIQRSRSGREVRRPGHLSEEQERNAENKATHLKHKRNVPTATLRGQPITELRDPNQARDANQTETQRLLLELVDLREELLNRDTQHQEELLRRDTQHQRELQKLGEALATTQRELEEIKGHITSTNPSACSYEGHSEIIQELQSLRSAITTPATASDEPSWAAVVANGNKTQSILWNTTPGGRKRQAKETNCIRVNTRRGETEQDSDDTSTFRTNLPPKVATTQIQKALCNAPATQDTQVLGVGITRTGYLIRFQNEEQADTARSNTEWLGELGNNTKLVRPRFGVVVHRTPTEDLLALQDDNARMNKIMEENGMGPQGFRISQIAWLRKDKENAIGKHGSLGIWFDTREAAEWLINHGLLIGQTHIGSVVPFQLKEKRCYQCQGFGHLAWACKERARCGHCAGDHDRRNCPPGMRARCLDCPGEHPTGDKTCPNPARPPSMQ